MWKHRSGYLYPTTRRLLNLLTLLSLVLCVGVVVLWVQSELHPTLWVWPWDSDRQFESADGELRLIQRVRTAGPFPLRARFRHWSIPYWLMLGMAGTLAASIFAGLVRRRRARLVDPGLCAPCGYDLRASKGRCPECGNRT
jgi:hypothetical protein